MIEAHLDFSLPVSPEQAFDYISDPTNDRHWQAACESAERLSQSCGGTAGDGNAAGSRYGIVFNTLGKRMAFRCEVTEHQRPSSHAFQVLEGPFVYRGRYTFMPDGPGTRVQWRFEAEPGGFFGLIPATLLRKVLLNQYEGDVRTLQRLLLAAVNS